MALRATSSNEAPPLIKLSEPEFFPSNIYERGVKIFLRSYLLGSILIILARQTSAFFLTRSEVRLESARSKMASEREESDCGMMVANIESASDCAASFLDLMSDSTE